MKAVDRYRLHVVADEDTDASKSTIIIAFVVNALVAIAKTIVAVLTGSASLRAEAAHSWVDAGNEIFVVAASRTATRPADEQRPLGYGRESYVWSLLASIGMLIVGAVVGVWQGVKNLGQPEAGASHYLAGYAVIAVSFVLEGISFIQSLRSVREAARDLQRDIFEHALRTSNSPLRAVFVEDFIALIALAIAALGLGLHQLTGNASYDAVGSIVIGLLMGVAALVLLNRNRIYLEGTSLPPAKHAEIITGIKAYPEVSRVTFLYSEFIGPERVLLLAGVGLVGEHTQLELATILRTLERRLMEGKYVGLAILTLATTEDDDARV